MRKKLTISPTADSIAVTQAFGSPHSKPKSSTDIKVEKINPWILISIITLAIGSAAAAHFTAKALGNSMEIPSFPFNGAIVIGAGISFIGVAIANEVHNRKVKMKALKKGEPFPKTVNTLHLIAINTLAVAVAFGVFYIAKKVGAPTQLPEVPFSWAVLIAGAVNIAGVALLNHTHQKRERKRKLKQIEITQQNPVYTGL